MCSRARSWVTSLRSSGSSPREQDRDSGAGRPVSHQPRSAAGPVTTAPSASSGPSDPGAVDVERPHLEGALGSRGAWSSRPAAGSANAERPVARWSSRRRGRRGGSRPRAGACSAATATRIERPPGVRSTRPSHAAVGARRRSRRGGPSCRRGAGRGSRSGRRRARSSMSLSRCSSESYIGLAVLVRRPRRAAPGPCPSALSARWATTWARVQPGSREGARQSSPWRPSTVRVSRCDGVAEQVEGEPAVGGPGRGHGAIQHPTTGAVRRRASPPRDRRACAPRRIGLSAGRGRLALAARAGEHVFERRSQTSQTTSQGTSASGRPAHHPGRPGAQPQGHLARPPARLPDRVHRPVRLGQVQPGVRHHLRRGPAPLRRVAVGVRPPVPRPDGQARRRLHRGSLARGLDRPEVHVEEPPLHRRHHHRGLRLPPPALRPRRPAPLPGLRRPDRATDAAADRRPRARARGGSPLPGAGPGDPRPQGGVRRALPAAPDRRLLPGPGQRRDPHARTTRPSSTSRRSTRSRWSSTAWP